MRLGLLQTISVNRLGCAKRTRFVSAAQRARRWLYRFYRIEGAVNSATLRAPPNLGRLRDVYTRTVTGRRTTATHASQLHSWTCLHIGLVDSASVRRSLTLARSHGLSAVQSMAPRTGRRRPTS